MRNRQKLTVITLAEENMAFGYMFGGNRLDTFITLYFTIIIILSVYVSV